MPAPPLTIATLGEGDPVVLVHSSGLSGRQWIRLARALAERGFRAVMPDLTGHGSSPACPEPTPFSYREDVQGLIGVLRSVGTAHLVGHSYGGLIALLAALECASTIRSMTLFDPVAFGVFDPRQDAEARAELSAVDVPWGTSEREHDLWLQAFVDYWGGPGAWLALREDVRAGFRRVGWVVEQGVTTLVTDRTPASAYGVITCPATLMTGELSPLAARTVANRLVRALPDARLVTVAGAGHMAPMSHADRVNETVLAFLTSL